MDSAFLILLTGVFATPCAENGQRTPREYFEGSSYLLVTLETTPREMAMD